MAGNGNRTKRPLSGITKQQAGEIAYDRYRTNHLIRGLRLLILSGYELSILDRIIELSKDGKEGTITQNKIESFAEEFSGYCVVPPYEGCKIEGADKLKEYIKCFIVQFIISEIVHDILYVYVKADDVLTSKSYCLADDGLKSEALIDFKKDFVKLSMNNEQFEQVRDKLRFAKMIDYFSDYAFTYNTDTDEGVEYRIPDNEFSYAKDDMEHIDNVPFWELYEHCFELTYDKAVPMLPSLIREAMIEGMDLYCYMNGLSMQYMAVNQKIKPNNEYYKVICEIRNAINNIDMLKDNGEDNE